MDMVLFMQQVLERSEPFSVITAVTSASVRIRQSVVPVEYHTISLVNQ